MESSGWINKIRLLINEKISNNQTERVTREFDIGTTFDKVQYSENNGITLKDVVGRLKSYFESKMFMIYRSTEPANHNVVQWYKIERATEEANQTEDEKTL